MRSLLAGELAAELERIGVTFGQVGAAEYVQVVDLGDRVWFRGPPASGLRWSGGRKAALERLARVADGAGLEGFWTEFAPASE